MLNERVEDERLKMFPDLSLTKIFDNLFFVIESSSFRCSPASLNNWIDNELDWRMWNSFERSSRWFVFLSVGMLKIDDELQFEDQVSIDWRRDQSMLGWSLNSSSRQQIEHWTNTSFSGLANGKKGQTCSCKKLIVVVVGRMNELLLILFSWLVNVKITCSTR